MGYEVGKHCQWCHPASIPIQEKKEKKKIYWFDISLGYFHGVFDPKKSTINLESGR